MTTDRGKREPAPPAAAKRTEREARLAAALRENLRKRKSQKSMRKGGDPTPGRVDSQDDS